MDNDSKIKQVLGEITKKKASIGDRPRVAWKTNGLIGDAKVNINTVSSIGVCVDLAAQLLQKQDYMKTASKTLGVEYKEDGTLSDGLEDLKLRVSVLKWDVEKKKLDALEARLKDLRSNDAKTSDAIAELESLL